MPELAAHRDALYTAMSEAGVDLCFLPTGSDLEYFTGIPRRVPAFGGIDHPFIWVSGAFFAPGHEPVFIVPRNIAEFDIPAKYEGEVVIVSETDDGLARFNGLARSFGPVRHLAVAPRTMAETALALMAALSPVQTTSAEPLTNPLRRIKTAAELEVMTAAAKIADDTMAAVLPMIAAGAVEADIASEIDRVTRSLGSTSPSFDTGVWSMGAALTRDANVRLSTGTVGAGTAVSLDFGAVLDGYCSDFGRSIHIGQPDAEYERVYAVVVEAEEAAIRAATPGTTGAEVDRAAREVIEAAGLGEWFRHRTGHCIGMDTHERPFISTEDNTPLQEGMTFTIEPSVFRPGFYGARVEDVVVCEAGGGRKLNTYPTTMLVSG
jgi:Xaa-Pro aminopeptidase